MSELTPQIGRAVVPPRYRLTVWTPRSLVGFIGDRWQNCGELAVSVFASAVARANEWGPRITPAEMEQIQTAFESQPSVENTTIVVRLRQPKSNSGLPTFQYPPCYYDGGSLPVHVERDDPDFPVPNPES